MNRLLRKCANCGAYTLGAACPRCGSTRVASPHPPRFSPDDRYLRYRMRERYLPGDEMKAATRSQGQGAKEEEQPKPNGDG